jgi:hypothetical protein
MIRCKETKRLFMDKYGYKAVLIVPGAQWFRSKNFDLVEERLKDININIKNTTTRIRTPEDLTYSKKVCAALRSITDYEIRVETPFISVYTNNLSDIDKLCDIDSDRVKYISKPPASGINKNTVIMEREGWDYKITLGRTRQSYQNFVEWAENGKDLVKLTGGSKKALLKDGHWGGSHFYIKNEKALIMARVFLSEGISRVDQVVKAHE